MVFKTIIVCACLVCLPYATCHTMQDARRLLADKLVDYEKTFRPIANQSAPLTLYVTLELVAIQEFDEVQEKLTITAVVSLIWIDEYMRWDPDDYGNMTQLVMESDKVWTPNLVLTNNVEKLEKIGDSWQVIRFTSDGIAFYYPGDVLSASCKVDVTYYPWDIHKCGFDFTAWAHSPEEISFLPSTQKVLTTYFSENGVWSFVNSSVETLLGNAFLQIFLHLERKPRFVLVNVIIPIVFMAFLNTMVFLIPVDCGERISYTLTVLLAIAVFLTLVGDNLPKTSSPMSIFSYYLLIVLVISICITVATIFNMRLYYTDDSEPVNGCLAGFARCMKCNCRQYRYKRKKNIKRKDQRDHNDLISNWSMNENHTQTFNFSTAPEVSSGINIPYHARYRKQLLPSRNWQRNELDDTDSRRSKGNASSAADFLVTWKDVSVAFDKIFLALSVTILTTATAVFFMYIYLSDRTSHQ